mgnify:FL=1
MSERSGDGTKESRKGVNVYRVEMRTKDGTLEDTGGRGERRRRVIGQKDGNSDIIKEMSKKRQERKGSTRRSKSIPDDLTIDGIISGLDVQEGNNRVMTML